MLPQALKQLPQPGFIFIDGDHRKAALLGYFQSCLPFVTPETVIAIDDIYWSGEMKEAWNEIINHPKVTLSIDLFRLNDRRDSKADDRW